MSHGQTYSRPASSRDVGVYRAKARERMRREDEFERRKVIRDLKRLAGGINSLEGKLYQLMLVARQCFEGTGNAQYDSLAEEIRRTGSGLQGARLQVNETVLKAEGEVQTEFPPLTADMRSLHTSVSRVYRNAESQLFVWRNNRF